MRLLSLCGLALVAFATGASAQQMHENSDGSWVNSAGGNIYGDSTLNPNADPMLNSNADPMLNADADPMLNPDADPMLNPNADPLLSPDGDPRHQRGDGDGGDEDDK